MKEWLIGFIILLTSGCTVDRSINTIDDQQQTLLNQFSIIDDNSQLEITTPDEPGDRLALCLKYIRKSDNTPLTNQKVQFYHTNISGEYQPVEQGNESSARLSGTAVTDEEGRIFIETIVPGDYGSSEDNRHIHSTVFGANPEGYDIHFKQYSSYMSKRFIRDSDRDFLADIKKTTDDKLVTFLTIACKFNKQN